MAPSLKLYDHPVSTYAQKVRIALRFKGIEFSKDVPKDLGSGSSDPQFEAANPRMEVPTLIDGDFPVFDSTTIIMYLEDKFPEKPLLPANPQARAEARMLEDVADTQYEAINWLIGEINWFERAKDDEAERILGQAVEQTRQIQTWLTGFLGNRTFFNGTAFGYADVCLGPVVNRSVVYGYGPEAGSPLQRWHSRISEIPCVKETFTEMAEGVKMMSSAGPEIWKPHGGRRREYRDHRLEVVIKNGGIGIIQKGLADDNIRFSWPHPAKGHDAT